MKPKRRYYVLTWDGEKETFTPQPGVRKGPYTLFGLRKAIRKLRGMGYACDYFSGCHSVTAYPSGDPSVSIHRVDDEQGELF